MPPDNDVTSRNLGGKIFEAAKDSFGDKFSLVQIYLKGETDKLAITLRMIIDSAANGEISKSEAKLLLNQQKLAASSVLTSAEGITAIAVQSAINAGLKVVKDFVNGKVGFNLL